MTWVKVDDALWRHRKVAALPPDKVFPAMGLWALALSWVGANLTDGYITDRAIVQVAGADVSDLADELIRVGLWERADGGFLIHDYLEYNPTSDEVLTLRKVREEAGRKGGKATQSKPKLKQVLGADAKPRIPYPVSRIPDPVSLIASADANASDESEPIPIEGRR